MSKIGKTDTNSHNTSQNYRSRFNPKGRKPYSDEQMWKDAQESTQLLKRAIKKYGKKRGGMKRSIQKKAIRQLSKKCRNQLNYMNQYSRFVWQKLLIDAMAEHNLDREPATLFSTTIIDKRWNFGDKKWELDLKKVMADVRNRCRGLNYIFMVEFAPFRNARHKWGRLIAPHIQGISWGPNSKSEMKKIGKRFAGGLSGSDPIHRHKVYDLPGAMKYSVKPPYYGYSIFRKKHRQFGHRRTKLYLTQHFFLYQHLQPFTYLHLTFASGEGVPILKTARMKARKLIKASAAAI